MKSRVLEDLLEGLLNGTRIVGYNEAGVADEWRDAALVCDNHWSIASRGFARRIPKIFVLRGKHKNIRVAISLPFRSLVERSNEAHTLAQI